MGQEQSQFLLHRCFEDRARRFPEGNALIEGDQAITYSELDSRAENAAAGLRSEGIQPGSFVGLHLERSIDWVVGLLAILKANAAVVPLAPSNPDGWYEEVLPFAELDAIIGGHGPAVRFPQGANLLSLSDLSSNPGANPSTSPGHPDQPAFVLCSSGSTGTPKMIVRSHRSFFHRLQWTWEKHPYEKAEVCCQKAHMTTTHALYELFEPLLAGTPIFIVSDREVRDLEGFWESVRARGISRLLLVPSALRSSLDMPGFQAPPLKVLVLMGEYVPPGLAERTLETFLPSTHLYSIYGSTEASSTLVCDLRESYRPGSELPLGKPISSGIHSQVLDQALEPVIEGGVGRLFMAGPALFSEYYRDPKRTDSVLVDAPGQSRQMFDTQDQVRVLPGGELEFIGRTDHTVKVRGFRVDLPEVERVILGLPVVSQAAVLVMDRDSGGASLVAFVTPASVERAAVFGNLRDHLPDYMVPSALVALDSFPLTASGKVDRIRLLEEFSEQPPKGPDHRALSETEGRVWKVWEQTLGHGRFELDDSFFEVGGDSLSVFSLAFSLHDTFGLTADQFPEQSVYITPSIRDMASRIDGILAGGPSESEEPTPLLVLLRRARGVEMPPFFLISSAGGTLGAYKKVVDALTTPREIIGVRDPFIWGKRDPTEGFQRWVGLYLEAIREHQPTGPYYIGAYSSAGAFGFEIARQLQANGQEVAVLALIDPLALDRGSTKRFGHWALRATYARPMFRKAVRAWGWVRIPAHRIQRLFRSRVPENNHTFSAEDMLRITEFATKKKGHLTNLSALLELNTGLPFRLTDTDFAGRTPEQFFGLLQDRFRKLTPDFDPAAIERLSVQYELQVRTQHAYELGPYDGPVFMAEPLTRYTGLLEAQFRAYVRDLRTVALRVDPPSEEIREIADGFGGLEAHFRCMRDDGFVTSLAGELDKLLA